MPHGGDSPDPRSTQSLLDLYREGDSEALNRLMRRYYDRVCAVVHRSLPAAIRPRYDTGDVIQEAMLRVLRKVDTFEYRTEGAFFSWLCTATERTLVDLIRHASRQCRNREQEVRLDGENAFEPASRIGDPGSLATSRAEQERVMEGLAKLDEELRRVLLYREYGRLTWKELGDATGMAPVTARRRYLKALSTLGKILS